MKGEQNHIEDDIRILNEIYTPLEVAKEEFWKRWNDHDLKKRVNSFLKDLPNFIRNTPIALLSRQIASPNYEFHMAYKLANKLGLKLVIEEFLDDKFCTSNIVKLGLARMRIFYRFGKNRHHITKKTKVIDISKNDGKQLKKVETYTGEKLFELHHRLLHLYHRNIRIYDNSEWINSHGRIAIKHYPYFFALFICYGVLLETFWITSSKEERDFVFNVVKPAFDQIKDIFGVRPIIVQLLGDNEDGNLIWESYPAHLLNKVNIV